MAAKLPIAEYKAFRRKYGKLLKSARTVMDTPVQRNVLEGVAATAFQAGYNAGLTAEPTKPLKLKPWKPTAPKL